MPVTRMGWFVNGCRITRRHAVPSPNQATTLLTMDKYAPDDIPNINSTCFKLNSLQLQALLQNYHCAPDEPFIPAVSGWRHGPHGGGRVCTGK